MKVCRDPERLASRYPDGPDVRPHRWHASRLTEIVGRNLGGQGGPRRGGGYKPVVPALFFVQFTFQPWAARSGPAQADGAKAGLSPLNRERSSRASRSSARAGHGGGVRDERDAPPGPAHNVSDRTSIRLVVPSQGRVSVAKQGFLLRRRPFVAVETRFQNRLRLRSSCHVASRPRWPRERGSAVMLRLR